MLDDSDIMLFPRGPHDLARPGDAMPHASTPSSRDLNRDDKPPSAGDIDVRLAPGIHMAVDSTWIKDRLCRAAGELARRESKVIARISVLVVDDARMAQLHERHSGVVGTTDVLTFDLREDSSLPVDADIVICADEAARRAGEFGHSVERELLLYCVHGLLHCMGFDDHAESDWRRMHAREDEILEAIGVGATFERGDAPGEDHA